ncbi:MAG: aminotransferase class V-fold PLP-dependent enzyme, partial [Bacteroidales bacterium]|nr:aminotransferase class V-fold PLP-dependent enzyme [Bacteroidales bacterium]
MNAKNHYEVVFTSGTTGSINALAFMLGELRVGEGDEIIVSCMEHHANIVPWQMLCERKNARLKVIPISDDGELMVDEFARLITDRTKIISLIHVSNVLGTLTRLIILL